MLKLQSGLTNKEPKGFVHCAMRYYTSLQVLIGLVGKGNLECKDTRFRV